MKKENKERTINWLEVTQQSGQFEGFPEEEMDFRELSDEDLEWYFENWVQADSEEEVLEEEYGVYDLQKKEFREETGLDKDKLAEDFRVHWSKVNYDSEYEDIINSDLDEDATQEEVEEIMNKRIYGVSAEEYLKSCGFEVKKVK